MLRIPVILETIKENEPEEAVLGTWFMAAHDIDSSVRLQASKSWKAYHNSALEPPLSFIQRVILDPTGVYTELNPVQATVALLPNKTTDVAPSREIDEEDEKDRNARLRIGALGALSQILGGSQNVL